jgi:hypothetical protein
VAGGARGSGGSGEATRRELLRAGALGAAAWLAPPVPAPAGELPADEATHAGATPLAGPAPDAAFFTDDERAALARLADHVLPGSARLGAVAYVEQLLTAFESDPPRLHAGGPFREDFATFLPLNRVQERAWRLRLYGSAEVPDPNREVLGPVPGLRPQLRAAARAAAARLREGASLEQAWSALPDDARARLAELVIESRLGDPVYGGNHGREGWREIHFAGDSLPQGYLSYDASRDAYRERPEAPVSAPDPGPDPDPLSLWTRATLWLAAFWRRWSAP